MSSFGSPSGRVLYLGVSAVPGAQRTLERIAAEQADGWDVCLLATERALHWFDEAGAQRLTGHPVQTTMRVYPEPLFEPLADRMVVAPAGFNTINKIALGLADQLLSNLLLLSPAHTRHSAYEPQGFWSPGVQTPPSRMPGACSRGAGQ